MSSETNGQEHVSRSAVIRETAAQLGREATPKAIVAAVKERGVEVSHSLVNTVLHAVKLRRQAAAEERTERRKIAKRARAADAYAAARAADKAAGIGKREKILVIAEVLGHGERPPTKDVIAALAKDGVKASRSYVEKVLIGKRRRRRRNRIPTPIVPANGLVPNAGLNVNDLLAAKAMIAKVGGVEAAQAAIAVLKKLG